MIKPLFLQKLFLLIGLFFLVASSTFAHAPNQSYIFLRVYADHVEGRFEITTSDLNRALGLNLERGKDVNQITPHLDRIQEYVRSRVSFKSDKPHEIQFKGSDVVVHGLGDYVHLSFLLEGTDPVPEALEIDYNILFDEDPTHRGLQVIEYNWKAGIHNNESIVSLIFSKSESTKELSLTGSSVFRGFIAMIKSGMHHIYIGIDHILFLVALLLPAVVRRRNPGEQSAGLAENSPPFFPSGLAKLANEWTPVSSFKSAFFYVLKVVTLFTVAHTITLSLAALQIVVLPSRIVESIIALSIALAAYHNIKPLFKNEIWIIVFVFGLFHGFGFASVLGDVGLTGEYMTLSLLGFNIGVELGQILIVCIIFPILYLLRKTRYYGYILIYGSFLLILIALNWFIERLFEINLPFDDFVYKIYHKLMTMVGLK